MWVLQDNNDHLKRPPVCLCARQCLHFVAGLIYKNNKDVLEIEFASCSVCTHREASAGCIGEVSDYSREEKGAE